MCARVVVFEGDGIRNKLQAISNYMLCNESKIKLDVTHTHAHAHTHTVSTTTTTTSLHHTRSTTSTAMTLARMRVDVQETCQFAFSAGRRFPCRAFCLAGRAGLLAPTPLSLSSLCSRVSSPGLLCRASFFSPVSSTLSPSPEQSASGITDLFWLRPFRSLVGRLLIKMNFLRLLSASGLNMNIQWFCSSCSRM